MAYPYPVILLATLHGWLAGAALAATAPRPSPQRESAPAPAAGASNPGRPPSAVETDAKDKKNASQRQYRPLAGGTNASVGPSGSASHGMGHYEHQKSDFKSLDITPTAIRPGAGFNVSFGTGLHLPDSGQTQGSASGAAANALGGGK